MSVHFMTVSLTLWLSHSQWLPPWLFVFVIDANAHQSEWLESVSPTDQYGRDALNFCNVRLWAVGLLSHSHCWWQTQSSDDGWPWHSRCVRLYSTMNFCSLLCQLCASGWAICTGVQYQKYSLSDASYQLGQCLLCSQELFLEHHFEVSWSIRGVWLRYWWSHWQACSYNCFA